MTAARMRSPAGLGQALVGLCLLATGCAATTAPASGANDGPRRSAEAAPAATTAAASAATSPPQPAAADTANTRRSAAKARSAEVAPGASPPLPKPDKPDKPERTAAAQPADDPYDALDRCPPEMALLPRGVCIDRWEASLQELLPGGTQRPWSPYEPPAGRGRRFIAVSRPDVVPQGYINGRQAAAACEAAGKRLCRAAEWARACRGPQDTAFPYGRVRRARVCNDDGRRSHPVAEAGRRLGWTLDRMWRQGMDHPLINQLPNTVEKTGAHAGCTNAYGAYDMVGNLHEWIDDPDGTFRGGFFMDTTINGDGCEYATTAHSVRYHDYSIGFRCCKDAHLN